MKGEKFILYSKPDGKVTKDFERRKRISHACLYCKKQKIKCDLQSPCGSCQNKKRSHLCHYEYRQESTTTTTTTTTLFGQLITSQSQIIEQNNYDNRKFSPQIRLYQQEKGEEDEQKFEHDEHDHEHDHDNDSDHHHNHHHHQKQQQKLLLYGELSSGTTNYLGPWHADVTAAHKEPGVRLILEDFEKKKTQKTLDCMRPWQQYENRETSVAAYVDPFLCGIEEAIIHYLVNIYWQFVNPIESFLDPQEFWEKFDRYNGDPHLLDNTARPIFCAVIWLVLAYASRSVPLTDWSTQRLQTDLANGTLMITVDPAFQKQARFIYDPCEFFLHCAETCFSHVQVFKSVKDIDTLTVLMLYIAYLHDGTERNWASWTLLGMASNAAQRLGLHQDPDSLADDDSDDNNDDKKIIIEKRANQRRNLYFKLVTMNALYSVDLGQMPLIFREPFCNVEFSNEIIKSSVHDGEFILAEYKIAKVLAQSLEATYPFYSADDSSLWNQQECLDKILEMELKVESLWKDLQGTNLALRDGITGDSNIRLEIALKLERPPAPPKIFLQRYILDTLIHKARFVLFRPFLRYKGDASKTISELQTKCLSSSRSMLENQFAVHNNQEIVGFNKFRWNYIFSHAFQAAVVLSLQKDFDNAKWELRLVQGSSQLYHSIRRHAGCAAARAHLVLSNLLGPNAVEVESILDDPQLCIDPSVDDITTSTVWKPDHLPSSIESLEYDFFASVLGGQRAC